MNNKPVSLSQNKLHQPVTDSGLLRRPWSRGQPWKVLVLQKSGRPWKVWN